MNSVPKVLHLSRKFILRWVFQVANFKIPARLAYGKKGLPPTVPPNANVQYEIEVFSADQTADSSLVSRIPDQPFSRPDY